MAYLRNNTVNLLNLHYAILALASGAGGLFYGAFLLRAGVPAAGVLVAIAAILAGRFALRPLILPLAKRVGLKPLVLFGIVLTAAQFPILARVDGVGPALYALVAVSALGDLFYWTCYHAYFAALGDDEHRGHQISVREAAASVIGIVAPLLGGWALAMFGAHAAFGAVAIVKLVSAAPLVATPNVAVAREAPGALKSSWLGIRAFAADGWIAAGNYTTWQIMLFVTLSQSFTAFGGAMALAALVGAVSGLFLGRAIDGGRGARAVTLSVGLLALTIAARALSTDNAALAVAANAFGALVACLYAPTLMTPVYTQAKNSPCPLRFHIATEAAFDVGCGACLLIAAGLIALGAPIAVGVALSLFGALANFLLLRRYYADAGVPAAAVKAA